MGAHDRVRRLTLNLDTFDDISELRTHPQDFPILACFELRVNAPGRPIGLSMLKTAPALRRFCLNTPSCSLDLEPAAVSWSQLTELTLNLQVDLGRARSILMECTGLEVCTIYTGDDWSEPPLQRLSSVTSLLHLTRFSILCCSDEDVEDFFDAFSFPSLTDLTVNATQLSELALPNLYSRSHFQLIKMDVDISEWVFTDELTTFLELTSSLEFLVLRVGGFQRTYMELFTYGGENPAPFALPKLRTLSIRMDHSMNTNPFKCRHDPSAAEMLESFERYPGKRNRAFPSLTRVFLTMIGDDFDRDIEKRLVNAGKRRIEGWYHRQRSADED
ncbi:hypothetical protein FB45DRAFT_931880 [Roridomyces roridus]|uniref:Uncharacterized protein n=1 Tax=Roridomyces roridus TaxID=1738132 RepID=A0AAD7FE31_9AGAR|nr:hypothetical protein FB45DRAFT_931880 [Roridomyces roridus]